MFVYLFVHSNKILLENFASNNVFYEDITIVDIEESIESVKLVSISHKNVDLHKI